MSRQRGEDGTYTPSVSDEELLAAVATHEPAATSDVAEEVGLRRQSADYRLRKLRDAGRVASKKIGASLVWFRDDGADAGGGDRDRAPQDPEPRREPPAEPEGPDAEGGGVDLEDRVAALELEGSGQLLARREAALVDVLEHLREAGNAHISDLKDLVEPDALGYDDAGSWWANMRRQNVVERLDVVEGGGKGSPTYYWVESDE